MYIIDHAQHPTALKSRESIIMYKQNLRKGPMQGSVTKFGGSLNFSLHYSPCMANSLVPLHGYNKL